MFGMLLKEPNVAVKQTVGYMGFNLRRCKHVSLQV